MRGVVLWMDAKESKAVIWCEDQGNLAFYNTQSEGTVYNGHSIDAGDLIQFDVMDGSTYRSACNLQRLDQGYAPALQGDLLTAARKEYRGEHLGAAPSHKDNVVVFPKLD